MLQNHLRKIHLPALSRLATAAAGVIDQRRLRRWSGTAEESHDS